MELKAKKSPPEAG